MKIHSARLKYIFLLLLVIICFIDCGFKGFPALPSHKAGAVLIENAGKFLIENFYAILYFCFSLVFGITAICFGIRLGKRSENERILFKAGITFGIFILLSGIWIITDSTLLMVFSDYINISGVVLVSFISFLLMPICFMKCLAQIKHQKFFYISENLFDINTVIFLLLAIFRVEQKIYLISLACHHILILCVALYFIVNYMKRTNLRQSNTGLQGTVTVILFFMLIIFSLTAFLLQYINLYSEIITAALMLLTLAVLKIMIDKTVIFYEENMKADFYKKMAYTDIMSGIYNRNAFNTDRYAVSESGSLCFVIFDINNMKIINDENGHDTGDEVICAAAGIIKDCLSPLGKCYRIGGDEFAAICEGKKEEELEAALRTFDRKLDRYNLDHKLKLSIAYGYAFRKSDEITPDELFDQADKNMYQCKKENQIQS